MYADCLVHCDNQYRAKQFFQEILTKEENTSFEKYEVAVSLLNQRFWNIDLDELIEDSKLIIEKIEAVTYCDDCEKTYPTVQYGRQCPYCKGYNTWLAVGNECNIKEIEAC